MIEWQIRRIADIGRVVGGATPSTKKSENYAGGTIPWITPKDLSINNERYIYRGERNITEEGLNSCFTQLLPAGTILFSSRAPIGYVAIAGNELCTNQGFKSVIPNESTDPLFLYYLLKNNKEEIGRKRGGTTFEEVSGTVMERVSVRIPVEIKGQEKIGRALGSLDDRIELLNAINTTLLKQVELLYNYWFTQFDFPDENGNPYRASRGEMVWNEDLKKDIPASWRVDRLANISLLELGGTPDTTNPSYWHGDINWLNSGEVAQFPVVSSELTITKDGLKNSATKLMRAGTVVVSITGNIRASILAIDTCANQSVVGIKENSLLQSPYVYPAMVNFLDYYERISTGNCQRHINKETLEDTLIVLPPQKILDSYYAVAKPLCKLLINNAMESHKLSKLRDWLLPMLMNGQVTVA